MNKSPRDPFKPRSAVPPFPGRVLAAGVIWMLIGALFVLVSFAQIVASAFIRANQSGPVPSNPAEGYATSFGIFAGSWLFIAGLRVARGSAQDMLVTSVLSILVGLLYFGLGVAALVLLDNPQPSKVPASFIQTMLVAAFVSVLVGCGLLLPGSLALAGRSRYLAWRSASISPRFGRAERGVNDRSRNRGQAEEGGSPEFEQGDSTGGGTSRSFLDSARWRSAAEVDRSPTGRLTDSTKDVKTLNSRLRYVDVNKLLLEDQSGVLDLELELVYADGVRAEAQGKVLQAQIELQQAEKKAISAESALLERERELLQRYGQAVRKDRTPPPAPGTSPSE
jgi:hypothetical protein